MGLVVGAEGLPILPHLMDDIPLDSEEGSQNPREGPDSWSELAREAAASSRGCLSTVAPGKLEPFSSPPSLRQQRSWKHAGEE